MGLTCSTTNTNLSSMIGSCKSDACSSSCVKDNTVSVLKAHEEELIAMIKGIVHDQILALDKKMDESIALTTAISAHVATPQASPAITTRSIEVQSV